MKRVTQAQSGATYRRLPITARLENVLEYAARQADVNVRVTSGGQQHVPGKIGKSIKGVRTGSIRHDIRPGHMGAADIVLIDRNSGSQLDMRKATDASRMGVFTEAAVAAGATGVGAGVGYMGAHTIHVGDGGSGTWGGASFINGAHSRGIARFRGGQEVKAAQNVGKSHEHVTVESVLVRPTIKRGSKGEHVLVLQAALGLKVDGNFGPETEKAVKELQKKNKLKADGIVGPITWRAVG